MKNHSTLIILEDKATWPKEVIDYVTQDIDRISQERELEQVKNLEGKSWLSSITDSSYLQAQQQLAGILRGYYVKAYHSTRQCAPSNMLQQGIQPLSEDTLMKNLGHVATELNAAEDQLKAEQALMHFVKSQGYLNQKGLVWLYLTQMQTQQYDAQDLHEYYGGRALRAALYEKRYKYYPLLKRIGKPVVYTCHIPIADALDNQVEELARQILDYLLDEAAGLAPRPILVEFAVNKIVLPTGFLETKEQLHLV